MWRRLLQTSLLILAVTAPAADASETPIGDPHSHGPDPAAIDRGRDAPQARAAAFRWCGEERASDDREHEVDNGGFRYHAVYAIPADAPSRLHTTAPKIQTDALAASALLERLYGRAIRYDLGTHCGPQYLDITTVRLPETSAELAALADTPTGTLDAVARALDAAGLPVIRSGESARSAGLRDRNWMVWLDGAAPPGACGQAMLYDDATRDEANLNNLAGKVAIVFRNDDGWCGPNSVRHEIAHNLGAVLTPAPNSRGGHCVDAMEDTMCTPDAREVGGGTYHGEFFDYRNDDYWDPPSGPPLRWWTVNLSRFICPDAGCNAAAIGSFVPDAPLAGPSSERPQLRVSARRVRRGWSMVVRARGEGSALVRISCRRSGRARSSTVLQRRAMLPRTLRVRVVCASRPLVRATYRR